MDLEIRHLQLVAAVADVGSLTKAGERLHVTQSALSHQLRDIESRLGTPLFLRVGKRLVLTPAGERLLASARDVLARLEAAEEEIRRLAADRAGLLRITTECYTCYHWLPPLLTDFRRRFPGVDVRIDVEATGRPVPMLLDGRLDLAVVSSPVRDRRLAVRPVFEDDLLVLVSPDHRLTRAARVNVSDLAGATVLCYPPREESTLYSQVMKPAGVAPARIEEVKLTEAITEMVRAGLGIATLARWAVQPLLDRGALAVLPVKSRGLHRRWSAVTPKALERVDYVRAFIELLVTHSPTRQLEQARRSTRASGGRLQAIKAS